MKKFVLVIMLIGASGCLLNAKADSLSLVSSTATTNSSSSPTQVISPNPAWAPRCQDPAKFRMRIPAIRRLRDS